jgi:hypothetical protein
MVVGAVLVAAAAVTAFDSPSATAGGCVVCSIQMECPVMQGGAKMEIHDIKNGTALLLTVTEPEKLAEFHQSWDKCKEVMDKATRMSRTEAESQLCAMCQAYHMLMRQGAEWECIKTDTGLLSLLTAKKGKVVKAIHQQAAMQRQMMSSNTSCCGPAETAH